MKKIYLSIALLAAFNSTIAQQKSPAPQTLNYKADLKATGTSEDKTKRIDSLLQSFIDQKKASSIVGFVAKGGNVVYNKAFGYKDVENKVPAAVDDYYILFSQTKAVTTVAFMTLVEKGLVSVDDPVSKYFPEISDKVATAIKEDGTFETRPVKTPMTFAHLMSHSSGISAGLVGKARRAEMEKKNAAATSGATTPAGPGQRTGGAGTSKYLQRRNDRACQISAGL